MYVFLEKMFLRFFTVLFVIHSASLQADDFLASFIRTVNPQISEIEEKINLLNKELQALPPLTYGQQGEQIGFHSQYLEKEDQPLQITIDLGKKYKIDFLAMVPVSGVFQGANYTSYGFPKGFQIHIANKANFSDKKTVYDTGEKSYTAPGHYPLIIPVNLPEVRYIKIAISKHWARADGRFLSAIGEFMAISGNRNVAVGARVSGNDFKSLPEWSTEFMVDGQTDLGLPISNEVSKVNGYLGLPGKEGQIKWVQLDLGQEYELDELRLVTAHPLDAPNSYSHGFPVRFMLRTSLNKNFKESITIADYRNTAYRRLGDNMAVFKAEQVKARFVRLDVNELWHISGNNKALALAEFQVISKGRNVALNSKVSYSDILKVKRLEHIWNAEGLVDGYSSQNKLIDLDEWLLKLDERRLKEEQIKALELSLEQQKESTTRNVVLSIIFIAVLLLFFIIFTLYRRRLKMKEELEKVRVQIARDLHDDLGSRIGGIRLVSEVSLADKNLDETSREDWESVNECAQSAIEAMRDIVWLTDGEAVSSRDMIKHLQKVAEETLGSIKLNWIEKEEKELEIPFAQRRHIVLSFRETLGNIVKHSGAGSVDITTRSENKSFSFTVNDDGCGFDLENCRKGSGLNNLQQRAQQSGGKFEVKSEAGKGTSINFSMNLKGLYE